MGRCKASWKAPTALATLPTVTGQGRRKVWKSEGAGQILIQCLLKENVWLLFFPKIWGEPPSTPHRVRRPCRAYYILLYTTQGSGTQSLVLIWFPPSPKPGSSYYRAQWYIMKSWWKAYFLFGFFVCRPFWWPFWPLLGPLGLKPSLSGIGKKLYCQEMVQVPQQHQGGIFTQDIYH